MTVMQGVRVTVAAVGRGYPKTAVTTVTAVTPKDGHPPKERRNPPMPYAILRFQKRKAGGVAACERHNERKKEAYKSNPDIDMERSKNNYHLIAPPKYTYKKEINRMVAEAGCRTRKDSVMMVETLITASPEFMNQLPPEEQKAYFQTALDFISERVGKQNILSAVVHMDERTPHMHLCFVPITPDNKLSAKAILGNQKSLSEWQTAYQKSILTDYVKKQGWHIAKTYVDDGYSGTNFQRPSFQNMIKDIESGLINCVITKDLSRLGRNYLDCGLYLEVFFPEHNVRYIAVNDGVDTLNKSAMDITPFRNILNEMYAADISVKIKSAYRARFQQGKFMGTTAPYGYIKDPADHNHLLIDDKVAHVVKEIFDLALKGNGVAKICRHLNKQHILRPAVYAAERGETGFERHFEGNEDKRYIWSGNSVRSILRSPIYAGNLVGYKRIAANMKSKKRPSKLPEEWEVIPNTHEGIVTQEEFDIVQQLITSRRLPQNKGGFVNIFAGVIKCVDCGCALRAMNVHRRKRPEIIDCVQYSCNNYARNGRSECSAHNIEARDLFNAVLADINCFADMAVNDEKAVRAIEKRLTETDQSRAKALEKERKKLNKRLAELDRLFSSLYEDKVMERITERNFEMMSGKYQKEQLEIEARLKEVTETLNESYEKSRGIRDFLALIRNYQGLKELDATVINALIDKILVSEREKMADGTVKQEIKIYYKFIGFVDELHIIPTKRWAAMPAKNCTVCGVEYVPGSGASRYCPACAKKIRREKSNESKRRSREQKRIACMNCPQKMTD